jgi:hypothetical protein
MSQNSNTKVPTQAAIRSYISSANHNFSGDITFSGTTTTIDSATLSVEDKNIGIGSVTTPTNTTANGGGLTLFGGAGGDKSFTWNESAQNNYWQLSGGQLFLDEGLNTRKMLKEECDISTNSISASGNIYLESGMVHYRSGNLGATVPAYIKYSASKNLNDAMAVGESLTVTIIQATNNSSYYINGIQIDGNAITENWIGGSAPSDGGASGVDIYTFNIIKTAANTFVVVGNQTKTS